MIINVMDDDHSNNYNRKTHQQEETMIYGLSGIVNTGNTCYMNSAIQAFSHIYPLTNYFFKEKESIYQILKKNAAKFLKDNKAFQVETQNSIPLELKKKIQSKEYRPETLTNEELTIVYNNTITVQLIKLLENIWVRNCIVIPTSFRYVFCEARNKFFFGHEQHDAEEAYSCILQQMQEELAEEKNIKFKTSKSVQELLEFKNNITEQIRTSKDLETKKKILEVYRQKKLSMPTESLIIEACRQMNKYYSTSYSRITEIFSGFLYSSLSCPETDCGYSSNCFEPFLLLQLPIPKINGHESHILTIEDCMKEFCKEERLDENNLWKCEGCNKKVRGIKKIQLWTAPLVLAIQLKRFELTRASKDSRLVKYPTQHLDIRSIVAPMQIQENKCYNYSLQCVINHSGGMNGGHYYSFCRDEDSKRWYVFNDSVVNDIQDSKIVTQQAYLLFYIREDMLETV